LATSTPLARKRGHSSHALPYQHVTPASLPLKRSRTDLMSPLGGLYQQPAPHHQQHDQALFSQVPNQSLSLLPSTQMSFPSHVGQFQPSMYSNQPQHAYQHNESQHGSYINPIRSLPAPETFPFRFVPAPPLPSATLHRSSFPFQLPSLQTTHPQHQEGFHQSQSVQMGSMSSLTGMDQHHQSITPQPQSRFPASHDHDSNQVNPTRMDMNTQLFHQQSNMNAYPRLSAQTNPPPPFYQPSPSAPPSLYSHMTPPSSNHPTGAAFDSLSLAPPSLASLQSLPRSQHQAQGRSFVSSSAPATINNTPPLATTTLVTSSVINKDGSTINGSASKNQSVDELRAQLG
jgi:hypothetical protein